MSIKSGLHDIYNNEKREREGQKKNTTKSLLLKVDGADFRLTEEKKKLNPWINLNEPTHSIRRLNMLTLVQSIAISNHFSVLKRFHSKNKTS